MLNLTYVRSCHQQPEQQYLLSQLYLQSLGLYTLIDNLSQATSLLSFDSCMYFPKVVP